MNDLNRETTPGVVSKGVAQVGDVIARDERLCRKCGKPHGYIVVQVWDSSNDAYGRQRESMVKQASWADPDDGHAYESESWESVAARLRSELAEAKELLAAAYRPAKISVSLTAAEWDDVLTGIAGCHGEFCISSDKCSCGALMERIEAQLPEPCEFCGDGPCPHDCAVSTTDDGSAVVSEV